jgi:hypothetical protein
MNAARISLLIGLLIVLFAVAAHSAAPDSLWMKAYGDTFHTQIRAMDQVSDSGYICTGTIWIEDPYTGGHAEVYTVRLDADGDTLWTTYYTAFGYAEGKAVRETPDGGFVTAGLTSSPVADDRNVYLVKLNSLGGIVWEKRYGGSRYDEANDLQVLHGDSGFVVTGYTRSFGAYGTDVYVLRTDSAGDTLFTLRYDATINDVGKAICETTDGYVIAGHTQTPTEYNVLLLKTTSHLDTLWSKTYGGPGHDVAYSVKLTPSDFGFIVGAGTDSYGAGGMDGWALKTDRNGDTTWTRTVGDSLYNRFFAVDTTLDGGYVFGGQYGSVPFEDREFYAVKLASDGVVEWVSTYGVERQECVCLDMLQTYDGGYVMGGYVKWAGSGYRNAMVIRLGDDSGSGVEPAAVPAGLTLTASPNPFTGNVRIRFTLDRKSKAEINIYDVAGRLVRNVSTGTLYPARHSFEWDGKDEHGTVVPPGVYFCRLSACGEDVTGKVVFTR